MPPDSGNAAPPTPCGYHGLSLLDPLFRDAGLQALFGDRARLQRMLDFEAALAHAEARCGVIPAAAAPVIAKSCDVALFDMEALGKAAASAGNPAIPLVKALTQHVAAADGEAARWVHWGATSQDVMDTGLVLQLREAFSLLNDRLNGLVTILSTLASDHRHAVLPGRTWLQQAVPVTFGYKVAVWLDAVDRCRARVREVLPRIGVLQFGGAAGTLSSLDARGLDVAQALGAELGLSVPAIPWHSSRDRIVEAGMVTALLAGTLGKIARDLALMGQTEVGEVFEPQAEGRGGSSTMPHKRNPVGSSIALSASTRVPGLVATLLAAQPQEYERGLGLWPAEWEPLPEIFMLTGGSLAAMTQVLSGLQVDAARMARNLDLSQGLLFAERVSFRLAESLGKQAAHELTTRACQKAVASGKGLKETLAADPDALRALGAAGLDDLFDPARALGSAQAFIDRVLDAASRG
jgi:3-carboxy-cis,cis-muconate cycloisomerase